MSLTGECLSRRDDGGQKGLPPAVLCCAVLFPSVLLSMVTSNVSLPFGGINVVALTDVHSWVGGHKFKEPHM